MADRCRRAWFLLACALAVALLWTHRYQYAACDVDGCVAVNRWTGTVHFRSTYEGGTGPSEGAVVVQRRPSGSSPRSGHGSSR